MLIQRLTIIGVGLIGGSLARALKQENVCGEIVGCGRNTVNLQHAIDLGVIDRYDTHPANAASGADMVIVAVPLGTMSQIFAAIRETLVPHAIITDVGSAKATVVADARQHLGQFFPHFVPAHPIAGTEKSGVAASYAELFENHRVVLTPLPETDSRAVALVTTMCEKTGALVSQMSIEHHDKMLAATSHLPHLLAYSLVNTLAKMGDRAEIFSLAGGGFRDFTRIASSDPHMWRDICLANKDAILKALKHFNNDLAEVAFALSKGDSQQIESIFTSAKTARDKFCG